jgi:hypothetical protein
MPAHSADKNLTLQLNTAIGTAYLKNAYTYQNGLAVTPNTAPSDKGIVDISVTGSNLLTPLFTVGAASTAASGHVYLVEGTYNPAPDATTPANKANGPVAECTDTLVFSNTEMVCRLQLWQRLTAAGVIAGADTRTSADVTVTSTSDGIITSPTAAFTSEDVGKLIAGNDTTKIAANTFIKSVTSPTTAVMSTNGVATGVVTTTTIGGDRPAITAVSNTTTSITAAAASFTNSDVGRRVTIAGTATIPAGTVITGVDGTGATATLSQPITAGTLTSVTVKGAAKVPDGAYVVTVVNNGALNAKATDPNNYEQSVVSSASTFTVANY